MSEKGGKGYSTLGKGGSLRGKDERLSAAKSAKGRRVQFANEDSFEANINNSPKSGWKPESAIPKGGMNKGGKGDKAANGGKIPVSKDPQPSDPGIGQELPENVKCLMNCEAADILQGIQEQMVMLSRDPAIKISVSFDRGLQYARSTSNYTNPKSVRRILEPLADYGLSDSEICMIANVCPETIDEVFALISSLKGKRSIIGQHLKGVLSELAKLKR